jgi:hypothetical protein
MPTIHGYSQSDVDIYRFNGVVDTTNIAAAGFDTNIYKTMIACSPTTAFTHSHRISFKDQNWGGAARASFRYQFITQHGGNENILGNPSPWALFKNLLDGRDLFRLMKPTVGSTNPTWPQYWDGAAWVSVGAGFVVPQTPTVHDIEIIIDDTVGTFKWWMSGVLMGEFLGDTKRTASVDIDTCDHYSVQSSQFGYPTRFVGHMLVSADYAPYGLQNAELQADGIGTDATQDSGLYSDVNELVLNRANGMTFDTVGDRASLTFSNLAGAAASAAIMDVRLSADVRRGSTGPA